jgi:hypothetical protein
MASDLNALVYHYLNEKDAKVAKSWKKKIFAKEVGDFVFLFLFSFFFFPVIVAISEPHCSS